ncbi:putative DNA-binding protein (MmcQ/YjbR family) [Lactobacillus colini]|uniref:DNA-binding protein (MmcQ/YjbR family) n=1 Tax=Lactobacillus colini TaxID=1819254 RepID=A0ABS4ME62_9LACO|nr:MmcQ/YjbR family DNA-binding protein [Lactobacillus colini]MBP2057941.1 putative DNA-binding protein (MmcQ/YjbR family) [Lactobacillus colini]
MTSEKNIFSKKPINKDKLLKYGFIKKDGCYFYQADIMSGQFRVEVIVDNDKVSSKVYDSETNEEYVLVHTDKQYGKFVGRVKEEFYQILQNIADNCCEIQPFLTPQANRITKAIAKKFAEKPDFPFKKFPDYGSFRNKANNKWYGLIMNIDKSKLTKLKKDKDKKIEILDLKVNPSNYNKLQEQVVFYPGYHMHKGNWITIILDESVSDNQIMTLLENSRTLTLNKQVLNSYWLIPANPKYYDIGAHFKVGQTTIWKQSTNIKPGDTIFLYVTSPVKAIRYQCQVEKVNIPYSHRDKNVNIEKIMEIKVLKEYDKNFCSFDRLKNFGIKAIRGPRRVSRELVNYLNKNNS